MWVRCSSGRTEPGVGFDAAQCLFAFTQVDLLEGGDELDVAAFEIASGRLEKFEEEFERHVKEERCPFDNKFTANWELN